MSFALRWQLTVLKLDMTLYTIYQHITITINSEDESIEEKKDVGNLQVSIAPLNLPYSRRKGFKLDVTDWKEN